MSFGVVNAVEEYKLSIRYSRTPNLEKNGFQYANELTKKLAVMVGIHQWFAMYFRSKQIADELQGLSMNFKM